MYRKNAGIVIFNKDGKVLLCKRSCTDVRVFWQFPQGGIDSGESITEAAFRETKEETGLTSVSLVAQINEPLRYDFTPEIIARFKQLGRNHIGQEQYWSLLFFNGDDSEIDFNTHPEEIEFDDYEWVDISESTKRVWIAKKHTYQEVEKQFTPIIAEYIKIEH